jgi:hypothetical protein
LIEPVAREFMLDELTHMGVDKDVCINDYHLDYHLKLSPSAIASASPMLSMLEMRRRPSGLGVFEYPRVGHEA